MEENLEIVEDKPPEKKMRITRGKRRGQFMKKKSAQYHKMKLQKLQTDDVTSGTTTSSGGGREIIETQLFSQQMWCDNCEIPLSLDFSVSKQQRGLAHIYTVQCCKCSFTKAIRTNSTFGENSQYFSVNAKAAMGMIDAGLGETQVNLLLSSLNISPVSNELLKRYERIVGKEIEAVAMETCSEYLEKEKLLTLAANDAVHDE